MGRRDSSLRHVDARASLRKTTRLPMKNSNINCNYPNVIGFGIFVEFKVDLSFGRKVGKEGAQEIGWERLFKQLMSQIRQGSVSVSP